MKREHIFRNEVLLSNRRHGGGKNKENGQQTKAIISQ
jgi:hypothetical protein